MFKLSEMPFDFPNLDFPALDFSQLDVNALRNVKLPNVDLPTIDTTKLTAAVRDAAYIAAGLGVVTVERVQATSSAPPSDPPAPRGRDSRPRSSDLAPAGAIRERPVPIPRPRQHHGAPR